MNKTSVRTLAVICILGTAVTFIGHGMLAAARDPLWVGLFSESLANMGLVVQYSTVANMTQVIGVTDVLFGLFLAVTCYGLLGHSALRRLVVSKAMLCVLGIAAFWQAATAVAVMVAEASFVPGIWSFFADAPKFLLPILAVIVLRQIHKA